MWTVPLNNLLHPCLEHWKLIKREVSLPSFEKTMRTSTARHGTDDVPKCFSLYPREEACYLCLYALLKGLRARNAQKCRDPRLQVLVEASGKFLFLKNIIYSFVFSSNS